MWLGTICPQRAQRSNTSNYKALVALVVGGEVEGRHVSSSQIKNFQLVAASDPKASDHYVS